MLLTCLLFQFLLGANAIGGYHHKIIVVLIDGFRWDYLDDPSLKLKGFSNIIKNGVKAEYLQPVYPSLSYPNIMSFSTGLYPENHGFVNNLLYDNSSREFFEMLPAMNSSDPLWWQDAEPVWITAQRNGLKSALYWWHGCEVKIHGYHPQVCERHKYDPPSEEVKLDFLQRVDDVVEMFKPSRMLNYDRLDLAMMYYSGVDWAGHYHAMDSDEMRNAIYSIDGILDYMQKALAKAGLLNDVNIMVLSDHGMSDTRNSTLISLEKYSSYIKYQVNSGPFVSLFAEEGQLDRLYNELITDNITGLHVYRKDDIPDSYHIRDAKWVGEITLECEPPYFVEALRDPDKRFGDTTFSDYFGEHGYAPDSHPDMRAVFLADGPDFRSGITVPPLNITDLYNLMCHILRIDPQPNNGTWDHVVPLLRTVADGPFYSTAAFTSPHRWVAALCVLWSAVVSVKRL